MTAAPTTTQRRMIKARILSSALADVTIDILLPLIVYLLLTALGAPSYIALTIGGLAISGKVALGRLQDWRASRYIMFVAGTTILAIALLLLLVRLGAPDVVAAAAAGVIASIPLLSSTFRRGTRIDGFGLLVLVEVTASVAVTLVSKDPRFVLARHSIYLAIGGIYAIVTCWVGRPLMLDAAKPMAAAGDPVRAQGYENAWINSRRFRTIKRLMTAGIGVVLIAVAALQLLLIYTSTRDVLGTGLIAQLPGIVLFIGYFVIVRFVAVPRSSAIVDREIELLRNRAARPVPVAAEAPTS
jgi:hypothetical protein